MESLNELIKTYVHNLSVFYCKKPEINVEEFRIKLKELDNYINNMFKE